MIFMYVSSTSTSAHIVSRLKVVSRSGTKYNAKANLIAGVVLSWAFPFPVAVSRGKAAGIGFSKFFPWFDRNPLRIFYNNAVVYMRIATVEKETCILDTGGVYHRHSFPWQFIVLRLLHYCYRHWLMMSSMPEFHQNLIDIFTSVLIIVSQLKLTSNLQTFLQHVYYHSTNRAKKTPFFIVPSCRHLACRLLRDFLHLFI